MIEFVCTDCGHRVVSFTFSAPGEPALCASCDWIRQHVPPRDASAVRERLGVPLVVAEDQIIPTAIWSGVFNVFDVALRCSVLDDGRRVIDAEDMHRLIAAMEAGDVRGGEDADREVAAVARWLRGG